nr:hypothetical protein [uncultured Oribacterium sp.]
MPNEDEIISEIYRSFNQDNVILFAGSDAMKNGELTKKIYEMPWSCVITTIKSEEFGNGFVNGRNPHRYCSLAELPISLFSRDNLPVIQLFGLEMKTHSDVEDIEEFLRVPYLKKQAEKMLNRVMSKMDIRSHMIVIGYNPGSDDDISLETFIFSCQEIQGGTITFFNSSNKANEQLKAFAIKSQYKWVDGNIASLLDDSSNDYEIHDIVPDDDKSVFYKGQKTALIKKSILSRSRNFAQLLTEEKVREIRPLGRLQQSRWFYNFLNNSSDSPQWYGFLPQSEFYLKRSYEEDLLGLVRKLLSGKGMNNGGWNTPIILEGDPGSSKSIELAAVAYKIFEERVNPVIYINGENLYFSGLSNETQVLDELMQEVEQVGEKDTRFLIVWDSSSYKNITTDVKQLAHELENRGRRFVLLCSAYSNLPSEKDNRVYYSYEKGNQLEKTEKPTRIYYYTGCYFVSATRKLEAMEIQNLKSKALLYAVADRSEINRIWSDLEGSNDIFDYFYRLIILLRPKLEAGLSKEQRLVNRYVRKQFSMFEKKEDDATTSLALALKNAGIDLDESIQKAIEEDEESNEDYDLDKFNICIAMFSRFKLDTPYTLALSMLCKDNQDYFGASKQYNNYELFKLLTTQISYIHYCEQSDGRFVFRFRSTLEAEIFLKNNTVNEDQQIEVLGELIDRYVENYRKNNEVDYELKESIQSILKMYGPNTDYKEFWFEHSKYSQHQTILKKLRPLADKVHNLRTKYHIPDTDGGMALIEISFYRELYGNLWDKLNGYSKSACDNREPWDVCPDNYTEDKYEQRLKKLTEVSNIALESLETLENSMRSENNYLTKRSIQAGINSLTVELAVSNGEIERIGGEYTKLTGKEVDTTNKPMSYAQLYPILFKAISASPLDGYLYNALFRLFEKEYGKASDEKRLYLLSDVGMIADDASTLEIIGRGANEKDELSNHLHRIAQYSCSYVVKIEDIVNKTAPEAFMKLFKSTVDRNNASGICFVCQQELDFAGLGGNNIANYERNYGEEFILNQDQLNVCQRIVDFINNPEYSNCIDNSIQALYLLLRVEWMLYNGRPLSIGRECQKTYLKSGDWLEVLKTCEKYESIPKESIRPVITLIYALSKVQIDGDYLGAVKSMHKISDMPNQRMRVPYLICSEYGKPKKYSGTVMSTHNFSGFLSVNGLPRFSEKNQGVKFFMKNLGLRRMPQKNKILTDFYLGLSLTGQFSAYKFCEEGEIE